MAYDMFSQPQGPQIDTSLFANATTAGINAGNALPTPLTSAIRGGMEGIQFGQQVAENYQQAQIRQNQIEQLPVQNEMARQQLESAKQINEINALKLDSEQKLHDLEISNTKAKLEKENEDITRTAATLKTRDQINKVLSQGTLSDKQELLKNPVYSGVIFQDKNYAEQVLGRLSATPGAMTPEEEAGAFKQIDFLKAKELEAKNKIAELRFRNQLSKQHDKDLDTVQGSDITSVMADRKWDINTAISKVTARPLTLGEIAALGAPAGAYMMQIDKVDVPGHYLTKEQKTAMNRLRLQNQGEVKDTVGDVPDVPTAPAAESKKQTADAIIRGNVSAGASSPSLQNGNVVDQREAELREKYKNDPDVMTRLRVKGEFVPVTPPTGTPTPEATAAATTEAVPSPSAPQQTDPASTKAEVTSQAAPAPVPPQLMAQKINYVVKGLPADSKKYVKQEHLSAVVTDPLTNKLPPLYQAMVAVESGGNRNAKSPTGATGLTQLTGPAIKEVKRRLNLDINRNIPEQNVRGGVAYLNLMMQDYKGNEEAALMAYNGGPTVINEAIELMNSRDYEAIVFGLWYMRQKGIRSDYLTPAKIKEIASYPVKVLANKEVLEATRYV